MPQRWVDRTFELGLPPAAAPGILERLRAAPVRAAATTRRLQRELATHRPDGRWSIHEQVGHLLDLEELWARRLDDFDRGAAVLSPADVDNPRTHAAGHNSRDISDLLDAFRRERLAIVSRLERMDAAALSRVSKHPRLDQPMSVVDLCFFVAEHDDHHLAAIAEIAASLADAPLYALELLNAVDRAVPALLDMDPGRIRTRPAADTWSPAEILGHLVDSASNNHQRFVRAAFKDDLVFDGYAQDEWVRVQRYEDAPWADLVALWAAFNRHLARIMRATPEAVRTAPRARHNLHQIAWRPVDAASPATLEYFMSDYVAHLQHHLRQLER